MVTFLASRTKFIDKSRNKKNLQIKLKESQEIEKHYGTRRKVYFPQCTALVTVECSELTVSPCAV